MIFSNWSLLACAPIIVSVSSGLPILTARTRSSASGTNVS